MADKKENLHKEHRERLKQKLLAANEQDIFPHELLEALLFYAHLRKDMNPLAHRLLNTFGSIDNLVRASRDEIKKVKGAGDYTAEFIALLGIFLRRCGGSGTPVTFYDIEDPHVQKYLHELFHKPECEQVFMLFLDSRKRIIKKELMFEGTFENVCVDMAEMMRMALLCRARSAVCVHNHPSGRAVPSAADSAATRKLSDSFASIGVRLVDHIIVTDNEIYGIKSLYSAKLSDDLPK